MSLSPDLTVEEALARWPETAVVFHDHATACVGCSLAAFCTLEEAAREYNIDVETFLKEMQTCIEQHRHNE